MATRSFGKFRNNLEACLNDRRHDHLRDAFPALNGEGRFAVVDEQNANFAAIICIDSPCAYSSYRSNDIRLTQY